jgi:coenzyme PQQ precursor peptide PqqA
LAHRGGPPPEPSVIEEERTMRWSKPKVIEVAVGLEINSYACAII